MEFALDQMFASPPISCVEILRPNGVDIGWLRSSEVIRIRWSLEGGNFMNGISALKRVTRELSSPLCSPLHEEKSAICNPEEGSPKNPSFLEPSSWISSLQTREK